MENEALLEKVEKIVAELRVLNRDTPVIVEGESDVHTLRKLGLEGVILSLNIGLSLFNFCEEIAKQYKTVIILTDWDKKGDQLAVRLSEGLKANDVKFNTEIRAKLASFSKETKYVEGLVGFINRLKNI